MTTTATKTYEGTKRVHARPMNRGDYNTYRGWTVPADENPDDPGYLVEYLDGGKSNHAAHAGYISWSPKDVFERAYREVGQGLSFDQTIEAQIQAKGKTAPRITPTDIEANIASEHYFTADDGVNGSSGNRVRYGTSHPLGLLTFCVLVLRNGFTVTGESACASPENFDAEIGRRIARQAAINKVWPLMGYELKTKLAGDAA